MTVTNPKKYYECPWEQYKAIPGHSFSSLCRPEGMVATPKMRLGSAVDAYIFTPHLYSGEMWAMVKPMAQELRRFLGEGLKYGEPQVSLTADFRHAGLTMKFKGRPDLLLGKLIVDLKVSEVPIHKSIELFRYDLQQSGYVAASGAERAIILSIHPKSLKITLAPVVLVYDWWEMQIKINGLPL